MVIFKKNILRFYWLILLVHCILILAGRPYEQHLTKLMLIPVLIFGLISPVDPFKNNLKMILAISGLLFSFVGDLLLIFPETIFFIAGMVAFMLTHICYTVFFIKQSGAFITRSGYSLVAGLTVPLLAIISLLMAKPDFGDLSIPIAVYIVMITIMSVSASSLLNKNEWKKIALICFIPGASFFIISDTILALNHFLYHNKILDLSVMLTYGIAQFFIARGFMHIKESL